MSTPHHPVETRVAVLVDCDNTTPEILDYALRVVAQFGRVVLRRGYGNHTTLTRNWQEALVRQAFTPCLQFQYVAGKNTADIALALDALEAGAPLAPETAARAQTVLDRAEAFEAASARPIFSFFGKRPPADLIIMVTPGVRRLVEVAGGRGAAP